MADKPIETQGDGLRIDYVRGAGKAPSVPSPLAMHEQQARFMTETPMIDKDRVAEQVEEVRRNLGSGTDELASRALSGNPWEVVRAQTEIETLLDPPPSLVEPGDTRFSFKVDAPGESRRIPKIIPERGIIKRAIAAAVGLYRHAASGRVLGLRAEDVDNLVNDIRTGDRPQQLRTSRETLRITAPIEEGIRDH